jgi:cytochrome c-type biogenesis protein CcmF
MVGSIIIKLSFAAALFSFFCYWYSYRKRNEAYLPFARMGFHGAVLGVLVSSAYLLYLILTHQFQYTYVWNYSSTDLPLPLLVSTFYAGQEGSFTLWTLYTVVLGIFLMQYSIKTGYEREVMSVYSLILSFLLLMLVVKNPFAFIWDTFPNELVRTGPIPATVANFVWLDQAKSVWAQYPVEGKGLNPLLQNYWMVIHPQILFVGFTAMSIPFTFAVAALLRKDYKTWVKVAKPWTVLGAGVLGTGIMLGGFWAYETLGWGGFWGWDPVENSSLIPWLFSVAAIHTMMAQRRSGTFVRTNFILAICCFVFVLYSTFLTRSGVLGDTSVHSFVDPGMWAYWLLLGCIVLFSGLGFGLLFHRLREMPKVPVEHSIVSREFALFLGASAVVFIAIFVTIGTSAPIITGILQGKKSAVDPSFYVTTTLPLGIAIALLSGIGQLLWWTRSKPGDLLKSLLNPLVAAVVFTIGLIIYGVRDAGIIIFTFGAAFSLFVNVVVGYRIFKGNPKYAGGSIAHIGLALMFLGFVSSERYDDKATVSLEKGKPIEILNGYTLTYTGYYSLERERYAFNVHVEKGNQHFTIAPIMYYSDFTQGLMRNPDVINLIWKDFYVSPLSLEQQKENDGRNETFTKGELKKFGDLNVKFIDFDFSDMEKGRMITSEAFTIGAILEIEKEGKKEKIEPKMVSSGGDVQYTTVRSSLSDAEFTIVKLLPNREDPSQSQVEISVKDPNQQQREPTSETLIVEASIKPFINLVWVGTLTMLVGFIVTIVRRTQEARTREG